MVASAGLPALWDPAFFAAMDRLLKPRSFAVIGASPRRTGIRVVGPNCLGLISNVGRLIALPGWYSDRTGPLAVVLQSGQMASSIATPLSDRGVGFSYVISSGNEADLEAADFMR